MMPRKKQNGKTRPPEARIEPEMKRAIWGTVCAAFGVVFLLALFGLAGPAGQAVTRGFGWLLGWGAVLVPVSFFLLSGIFFLSGRTNLYATALLGMFLLLGSVLGITHEFEKGAGLLGSVAGSVSKLFGFWAGLVILAALGLVGAILTFNIGIRERTDAKVLVNDKVAVPLPPAPPSTATEPEADTGPKKKSTDRKDESGRDELHVTSVKRGAVAWQFPPLSLLERDSTKPSAGDIKTNAMIIQRTLQNFDIPVEMGEVHVGPTVTQYTLKPAQGVKLSKIVSLQNDLSLALAAHPLRIEAPIPGQALVGIEVPNRAMARVRLGSLLELPQYANLRSLLSIPLGRDVMGEPVFADLTRMPHLLVAGATGSGKSIFIHGLITSLFFKNAPDTLRLILIDPKRVELSQYADLPYLLTPVITDGKRSIQALRWAIGEMDRRYDLMLAARARDVFSYNQRVREGAAQEMLPFIVIIIDELADLMAAYGREIEGSIVRLAQMARATGIHLVVSTQRPSVEVITGLIKANITSRVAFQVASQVDSRTILDMSGAEKLLGSGDMLYLAADSPKPRRIQSSLISEDEIKKVAGFIKKAAERADTASYERVEVDLDAASRVEHAGVEGGGDASYDEMYPEAYRVVVEAKKASASLLQRRLKVGYARAARLLDILEAKGVIGPGDGAKPREVFASGEPTDNPEEI